MKTLLSTLAVLATLMSAANAAEIWSKPMKVGQLTVPTVFVKGTITDGDQKRFYEFTKNMPAGRGLVALQSNGGQVSDGLNIGLMIRQKKMATVVFDTCASVCALIWLAGTPRAVFEDSNVGFHAVYNGTEDKTINSGGNALVGAYLKQLGFSYQTIFYLTQTAPEEMEWLNGDKAKKYGIAVTLLDK